MKKLILSLTLILAVSLTAMAQPGRTVRKYYYDNIGELRLHAIGELGFTDLGGIFFHEYPYHYSAGGMLEVQTGRLLSLGLGAEYYGTRNIDYSSMNDMDQPYFQSLPVYANVRLSTAGYGTQFFVEARAGYAFAMNTVGVGRPATYYETQGLFTGGGIGFSCYGNHISVGMNAIDISNNKGVVLLDSYYGEPGIITDFYIRYSYSFPLNY